MKVCLIERSKNMKSNRTLITAHAGCMGTEPNTMSSILKAIECNADIIELDVNITKDEMIVLSHDSLIKTPDGEDKHIDNINLKDLKIYKSNLLCLEEALCLIKKHNKIANLDIKNSRCLGKVIVLIQKYGMENSIIFSGCSVEMANFIKCKCSDLKCLLNIEDDISGMDNNTYIRYIEDTCYKVKESGCIGINIDYNECTKELIRRAHFYGIFVYIWTVDEEMDMLHFVDMNVDSITTMNVELLKRLMLFILKGA